MSPFEIFRRNLKPAMVVLVGLSMFAFVVLPAMDSYLRSGYSGGSDTKLAEIDGVEVSRSRVDYFTRNHQTTVRFLRQLAEETIRRGGAPRTPGFSYDTQTGQVQQVGINDRPSEFGSVRTMQLAAEANKAGFELDDTAIKVWLSKFTDGTMSDSEIIGLLAEESRNSMGQFHLYEQLRTQLLAGIYQQSGTAGLVTKNQMALTTPTQQWGNFLKLNRQATVNAYGLMVQDFYDQTNEKPTASEIQAVYDDGKERFANRQSPDPGFRRRDTATFEFVAADMQAFIDREVAKLSEDEIREEYDKQIKGGAFTMPDVSGEQLLKQAEEMKAVVEAKAAEAKEATDGETSDEPQADDPEEKEVADEKAEMAEKPEVKEPAAEVDAAKVAAEDDKPAADKAELDKQVDDFKKEIEDARQLETEEKEPAAETDDQSSAMPGDNGIRLVALQDDEKDTEKTDEADKKDGATEEAVSKDDATAETKTDETKPAEEAKPAEMKAGEGADDAATAESTEAGDETAGEPASDDAAATGDAQAAEGPKVRTFEEARDQVAQSMVRVKAGEQLSEAMAKARAEMRLYFNKQAIYESNKSIGQDGEAPTKPDLEKMAAKLGLIYGKIGPLDEVTIADEPISNSVEMGTSLRERGPPFVAMMYGLPYMGQQMPKQQLYAPLGTVDTQAERSYISWKISEKDSYIPELDEVKEDVIQAIRMSEARDLARAKADELVAKIEKGEKLEDLVPEDKAFNYYTGLGPFSWMQSFGFGGAFLGNVPKLDSVGEEFMETAFTTEVGKVGVAANLPERVVYLVQPVELQPTMEDLKERFKQPQNRMMAATLGVEDAGTVYQGFFESTDKRTGFSYDAPTEE